MLALSVRAPWWWCILHLKKDIENRDWTTRYRGRFALHASKWFVLDDVISDWTYARDMANADKAAPTMPDITWRGMRDMGGHIVGTAEIVDCVSDSPSLWFVGKHGFVLANPKPLATPIPVKGRLGFFMMPREIETELLKEAA